MIEITWSTLKDAAYILQSEVGYDFRYIPEDGTCRQGMDCQNWHEDGNGGKVPGCIVGTLLHRLGVPLEAMSKSGMSSDVISGLTYNGIIAKPEEKVTEFLYWAQVAQDNGATWYSAIKIAEGVVRKYKY